ncbi:hypothetical protein HN446_02865 [bacterium]|jgi:hypothetical protein|nr:hypothetical protein [bacterium]
MKKAFFFLAFLFFANSIVPEDVISLSIASEYDPYFKGVDLFKRGALGGVTLSFSAIEEVAIKAGLKRVDIYGEIKEPQQAGFEDFLFLCATTAPITVGWSSVTVRKSLTYFVKREDLGLLKSSASEFGKGLVLKFKAEGDGDDKTAGVYDRFCLYSGV